MSTLQHTSRINESSESYTEEMAVPTMENSDLSTDQSTSGQSAILKDGSMPLPCVLPQTTKSFRGAFFSPFVRAYVPELERHGISQATFLAFIDGLNEAFVANPVTHYTSIAGAVMTQFHGVPPVQWAGMGLQTASGVASAATSYFRTQAYVGAVNTDLFHPAGLHLGVMTTPKMMVKVNYPEEKLLLGPLKAFDNVDAATAMAKPKESAKAAHADTAQDDFRMRRIQALHGYIMPLDFNVPEAVAPDNLLRKMGASQASRMAQKQHKKMIKERTKGHEDYLKKMKEADKKWSEGTKEVEKIEQKLAKEKDKADRKIARSKSPDKVRREFEKEERKLLKELEKEKENREKDSGKEKRAAEKEREKVEQREDKTANKIRWLVIAKWDGEESQSDVDGMEAEEPPSYVESQHNHMNTRGGL